MDEDFDIEQTTAPNVPVLSLQDLMSPRPNGDRFSFSPIPLECRDSVDTLLISNLLPQFQGITVENNDGGTSGGVSMRASSRFAMDVDEQKDFSQDFYSQSCSQIDLEQAIQSAIQRRRSMEPRTVINQHRTNETFGIMEHLENPLNDTMTSIPMERISRVHRFIHFHIDKEEMESVDDDVINQRCSELLDVYVSRMKAQNEGEIECQTMRYNATTSQCTLYLTVDSGHAASEEWSQRFLDVLDSFPTIPMDRNGIAFDQYTPE